MNVEAPIRTRRAAAPDRVAPTVRVRYATRIPQVRGQRSAN